MLLDNLTTSTVDHIGGNPIISTEVLRLFTLVNYVILVLMVSFFGVIFNLINIIVFIKMGFKDPINISLLALAISDIGSLLPLAWMSLCYNPLIIQRFPSLDFQGIQHITAGTPHVCFTRITSWLTALITFERYLCVAYPLKVKSIVTPGKTLVAVVSVYVIIIAGVAPEYYAVSLSRQRHPISNMTIISIAYAANGHELESAISSFVGFAQVTSFCCVVMATIGLVQKIKSKSKWRKETSSASKSESTSIRDRTLVKMIVGISTIFIITYLPVIIFLIVSWCEPEFTVLGRYANLFLATGTVYFCLEAINSSMNSFVYLKMSSKYREVFKALFRLE